MPHNSLNSSPSARWSLSDYDITINETFSPRPSSDSRYTDVSDSILTFTNHVNVNEDETPRRSIMWPFKPRSSTTSDIRQRIETASPGTAKVIALEMYERMKKHGLRDEIGKAFLLRDGFVSYLRDVVKITPPIPQQLPFLSVRETLEFARDCSQTLRPENFTPQMRKFFAHALVEGQDPFLEYILEILNLKDIEHKLTGEAISDVDRQKLTTAELALGTYSVMLYDQPLSGYQKPLHVETAEFLEDIVAGFGSQYMVPEATALSIDELAECYRASDQYKDIVRIITGDRVKHIYWVESEPGLGLSLKTPLNNNPSNYKPSTETELVVTKISTKFVHLGGIQSTGRVQVGDVVTAVSINGEESLYLALGPQRMQHEHVSCAYSTLKNAEEQIRIQVERIEEKDEYEYHWEEAQTPFTQTWWKSTQTLLKRQIKITKRLHILLMLRLFQAIILGLFTGTLFYKLGGKYDPQKMSSVRALGFVSTMSIMLINLVQLPLFMLQRPIFYKHRAQRFFRSSSYVVAHCVVNIPQTFIEAMVYSICVYFLAGLSLRGTQFLMYLLLLFLVAYFGSSVFFFLSAVSSIPEVGNTFAGLLVSIFLLFSGFVIYPSNIPSYWKWLIYVNPIHWANISYCRFQFQDYVEPCSNYKGHLPFCDQFPSRTVGNAYLRFYELYYDTLRPWLPYTILLGWTLLMNLLALLGLKKLEFTSINQSLPNPKKSNQVTSQFRRDSKSEPLSAGYHNEHTDDFSASIDTKPEKYLSAVRDVGQIERLDEDLSVDLGSRWQAIPVEPVSLIFEDLSFARFNEEMKERELVFSQITGYANPGNMLAILGGSQASKTMLLKCLAGRINFNLLGNLQANDVKPGDTFFRLVGYVEKLDAHQPYLSVRESLQFSAALRLNQAIDFKSRHIHVELVLDKLGLLAYSNHLVGSLHDATGKTFEIARKITIAVELAANPSILFLEEPIYGLDSTGIWNILTSLLELSGSGLNIIATLTHPNMRTLSFFNQALILTKEGKQAYFGATGENCRDLVNYFSSIPNAPKYLAGESPISFIMDYLGQGIKSRAKPSLNFADFYKASALHELTNKDIIAIKNHHQGKEPKHKFPAFPAPYSRQAGLVLLRTHRFLWRNVQYTYGRLTGCIIIGFLMGSLYFQIEYKDIFGATSRSLYIYMQVILIGVISANNIIPQIGTDRLVYLREKRAGMYLPIFYPLSWAVSEIPYFFIATLAMVGIGNGMAGIGTESVAEFLMYWLILFVFTLCVTYFGMMVTFLAPLPVFAAFLVSIITSSWVSASGVVVVLSDIKFYKWMYWTNPFQYAMNAMTSISFYCNTTACGSTCNCSRLPDGSYVWDRLAQVRALNYARIDKDILILSAMCIFFASLAFLFFVILKHNKNSLV